MRASSESSKSLRFLVGLACFVVVAAGIQAAGQILVPFLLAVVFILFEASSFPRKFAAISGHPVSAGSQHAEIAAKIKSYLAIKSLTSLATGMLIAVLRYALNVDFPLLC